MRGKWPWCSRRLVSRVWGAGELWMRQVLLDQLNQSYGHRRGQLPREWAHSGRGWRQNHPL